MSSVGVRQGGGGWPAVLGVANCGVVDSDRILPGVLLSVVEALALDLGGPSVLDGGGKFGDGLVISRVDAMVDGEVSGLNFVICSEAVAVMLLEGVRRGGWSELAEVLLSEKLTGEFGEIWRPEAVVSAAEFVVSEADLISRAIGFIGSGGAYFYPDEGGVSPIAFPTAVGL